MLIVCSKREALLPTTDVVLVSYPHFVRSSEEIAEIGSDPPTPKLLRSKTKAVVGTERADKSSKMGKSIEAKTPKSSESVGDRPGTCTSKNTKTGDTAKKVKKSSAVKCVVTKVTQGSKTSKETPVFDCHDF